MPRDYDDLLAANIRAARARADLTQATVTERMQALGFTYWHRQTMGNVERGRRQVLATEIWGLSAALNTPVRSLMATDGRQLPSF